MKSFVLVVILLMGAEMSPGNTVKDPQQSIEILKDNVGGTDYYKPAPASVRFSHNRKSPNEGDIFSEIQIKRIEARLYLAEIYKRAILSQDDLNIVKDDLNINYFFKLIRVNPYISEVEVPIIKDSDGKEGHIAVIGRGLITINKQFNEMASAVVKFGDESNYAYIIEHITEAINIINDAMLTMSDEMLRLIINANSINVDSSEATSNLDIDDSHERKYIRREFTSTLSTGIYVVNSYMSRIYNTVYEMVINKNEKKINAESKGIEKKQPEFNVKKGEQIRDDVMYGVEEPSNENIKDNVGETNNYNAITVSDIFSHNRNSPNKVDILWDIKHRKIMVDIILSKIYRDAIKLKDDLDVMKLNGTDPFSSGANEHNNGFYKDDPLLIIRREINTIDKNINDISTEVSQFSDESNDDDMTAHIPEAVKIINNAMLNICNEALTLVINTSANTFDSNISNKNSDKDDYNEIIDLRKTIVHDLSIGIFMVNSFTGKMNNNINEMVLKKYEIESNAESKETKENQSEFEMTEGEHTRKDVTSGVEEIGDDIDEDDI